MEIEGARDHAERQYAEPDGTVTLETYATPQWARNSSGDWVDADPTLATDDTGAITTSAGVVEIAVSPGGTGPLVRASDRAGRTLSVTWPEPLPAPRIDGATATYPGVFDGIDLRVTAASEHFSYALVVHSAEAAAAADLSTIDVKLASDGLELTQGESGEVVAANPAGERVFAAAGAQMWDSSKPARRLESGVLSLAGVPAGAGDVMLPGNDIPDAEPGRIAAMPGELVLAGGERIMTTASHPFWEAATGSWIRADQLEAGHEVLTQDSERVEVAQFERRPYMPDAPTTSPWPTSIRTMC